MEIIEISKVEKLWFEFNDAKFEIKDLLSGSIMKIQDKALVTTLDISKVDGELLQKSSTTPSVRTERLETFKEAITDWKNVTSGGKPFKCTPENKTKFCENLPMDVFNDFYKAFSEARAKLSKIVKKQSEKVVKN